MNRIARWVRTGGLKKLLLYSGYYLLLICLLLYPGNPAHALQAGPTATSQPTTTRPAAESPTITPEPGLGAQVGLNAGLVCGAVILVIIIIAGLVRSARWMDYRGHKGEGEGG